MEAYNNEDPRSGADGQVFDKPDNLHCLNYSSVKLMHANKMQQHWISIKIRCGEEEDEQITEN
jgi:hypothetical protein